MASRALLPAVLLVIGIAGVFRFLPSVRAVDAIGLFACGALAGVSFMRLLMAVRRR